MKILAVDLSSLFWTIAQAGSDAGGTGPRDYSLKDIRELAPTYDRVVVAVDGDDRDPDWPQPPWRRSIWSSYKDRSERAPHHWQLLRDTIAHCEAEGWIVLRSVAKQVEDPDGRTITIAGFTEADDVLGSVVAWARGQNHEVDIRTGDSDLGQLVTNEAPPVRLLRKHKGQRSALDALGVKEWVGVPPRVVAAYKALAGDDGDGYGGNNSPFPGIGPETAKTMLRDANGDAVRAVEMAIASEKLNADGKTVPRWIQVCRKLGVERARVGLLLSRVATDLPLDFSSIDKPPAAKAPPSLPAEPVDPELSTEDAAEVEAVDAAIVADREARRDGASTAIAIVEPPRMLLAPRELTQRDREISALIKGSLKNGPPDGVSDYGLIPGCGGKPALFDVGAERLAKVFGLYPKYKTLKEIELLSGPDAFVYYRVRCRLLRVGHDYQVGECIAAANSQEKTFVSQKKPIFDLMQPVLARACKRAFVKAVLRATGAQKYLSSPFDDLQDGEFGDWPTAPQWQQK